MLRGADSTYDEYVAATDPQNASDLYGQVRLRLRLSIAAFVGAGVLWVWNLIDAAAGARE